jgi:hypothetical protein
MTCEVNSDETFVNAAPQRETPAYDGSKHGRLVAELNLQQDFAEEFLITRVRCAHGGGATELPAKVPMNTGSFRTIAAVNDSIAVKSNLHCGRRESIHRAVTPR